MKIFNYQDRAYLIRATYPDKPNFDVAHIKKVYTDKDGDEPLLLRGKGQVFVLELIPDAEYEDL